MDQILSYNKEQKESVLVMDGICMKVLPEELKKFEWVKEIRISHCGLNSLQNLPPNVEFVYASDNYISEIKELPKSVLYLDAGDNMLTEFRGNFVNLKKLKLYKNKLSEETVDIPKTVIGLDISKNCFKKMPKIDEIKYLDVSDNELSSIDKLPDACIKICCNNNNITTINLSKKLKELHINCNQLEQLPNLTENLIELNASQNEITICPILPDKLRICDLSYNNIHEIKTPFPPNIESLDITGNMEAIKKYGHLANDFPFVQFGEDDMKSPFANDNDNENDNDRFGGYNNMMRNFNFNNFQNFNQNTIIRRQRECVILNGNIVL